jgi:hypothetical protein
LQRLPGVNIERPEVRGKIVIDKDPGTTDFRPWNAAQLGATAQFFGVDLEKRGRFQ